MKGEDPQKTFYDPLLNCHLEATDEEGEEVATVPHKMLNEEEKALLNEDLDLAHPELVLARSSLFVILFRSRKQRAPL